MLACIALTAWWASGGKPISIRYRRRDSWLIGVGLIGLLVLGMSGALTALGDTLFPISSLAEGIEQDFSPTAHFLIRLRILHPTIAVVVSVYLIIIVGWIIWKETDYEQRILGRLLTFLLLIQLLAGLVNVILLAPVWLQLVHLFLSDTIWIALVLFSAISLSHAELAEAGITETGTVVSQSSGIS